jgi:hypothetical protein
MFERARVRYPYRIPPLFAEAIGDSPRRVDEGVGCSLAADLALGRMIQR